MRSRSLRAGLGAGLLSLVLVATGCGDSAEESDGSGGPGGTSGETDNTVAEQLGEADCGTLEYDADAPSGGTFTDYAYLSDSGTNTSFDPGAVQTLAEAQITTALFDGLTEFDFTDKCKPELKGQVAESWESNEDATEFTFQLKDGLTFSNGDPVLPSNFKIAWERAGSAELGSAYGYLMTYIEGGAEHLEGAADDISGVVADDDAMTLTVTLSSPNADFPAIVTHTTFSPITNDEAEQFSAEAPGWGTAGVTIGNGPFMLESADETEVVLVPNPEWAGNVYGDTEVKLDRLVFKTTIDVDTAYQAFDAGEGESAPVPPGRYTEAKENYPQNSIDDPNLGSYYFDFGADSALWGEENLKLRQAISLAIDREDINTKVYEGTRQLSTGIVPPGIPGFEADLCEFCEYDPDRAKTLYDEWEAEGGTLDGPVRIDFNEGGGHGDVAQIVQENLKQNLGLDAELAPVAEDYFKVVAEEGGCVICRSGWYADYPTYGNFMVDLFSEASIGSNNFGRYSNSEFEEKIAAAQAETDEVERGKLYAEAERILLNEDVGAIPLNWYTGAQVYRDSAHNIDQPPLGIMLWERVAVDS
jgi:oligopeptide transport system substrate-binding protein